jgi:AcrR family transcriptional regulator
MTRTVPSHNQKSESAPRRVSRQRQAGEATRRETRRILVVAARQEFAERGYHAATVARIAERADVAVQTLYSAWGSKRALLRGVMETSLTGDDDRMVEPGGQARRLAAMTDGMDSVEYLTHLAHEFRLLAERAALGWQTYRDAAAVDPEAAEDWQQLMDLRRDSFVKLTSRIPSTDLRQGLTPAGAADTAWVIASPDTHDQLIRYGGYTYDQFEDWVRTTLIAALLR